MWPCRYEALLNAETLESMGRATQKCVEMSKSSFWRGFLWRGLAGTKFYPHPEIDRGLTLAAFAGSEGK